MRTLAKYSRRGHVNTPYGLIGKNNQLIIKKSEKMIRSSADAYSFLQVAKNFFKILINSSEKKTRNNETQNYKDLIKTINVIKK